MASNLPKPLVRLRYEKAAEAYLRSLPLEHFMESTRQARQRKITLESLDLVHARRPDIQAFNELLVQYPHGQEEEIRRVVPDNMVVVHSEPIEADGSFDLPLQPVRPFWMLEYVSKHTERKDYEDNFRRYESELKVPYSLIFHPDEQELLLFHRSRSKYVSVKPNEQGRYAIPELEIEVAILDGWVRFWFRGELLPLPADLQRQLDEARQEARAAGQRADDLQRQLDELRRERDHLRAELGRKSQP